MILVIGAGKRRVKGATHHDVQPFDGIDIVCDFWDLDKHVEKGSCDEIHTTHFLEHIPMADTQAALVFINLLLKPGGKLYIEVPNFAWHAKMILENPRNRQIVEYAYGGQGDEWDYHYNGFTPETLEEDLVDTGYKVVGIEPNSSIELWAEKTVNA